MSNGELLSIDRTEIEFPFVLRKKLNCSLQLTNITQEHIVAFKFRTTQPKKYTVRPNTGVMLPGTTTRIKVSMQAQREVPPDMQFNDKFLIQSVIVPQITTREDIGSEMFEKEDGKVVEEFKLLVVLGPANSLSSESEESDESEEGTSPRASVLSNVHQSSSSESNKKLLSYLESDKPKPFSHDDLKSFTSDFAPENKIGFGGYAVVYKGQLPNGLPIAVKVLIENDVVETTFMAEVSTMGKTYHRNLVKLYGFCFEDDKKALVYEYMENGSLDSVLYNNHPTIEWDKLYRIAIETAKALSYLHDGCKEQIVHYDVKAANVLLDAKFSPKLTDFGIAKLMSRDLTHVTLSGIRGTRGYTAPEVWMPSSPVTYKCDVYSYGMMLFEILGRSNNEKKMEWFPKHVWEKFENGQLFEVIEDCGIEEKDRENAEILSLVALWCAQFSPRKRPFMSTVVKMLQKEIPVGKPPNPFPS